MAPPHGLSIKFLPRICISKYLCTFFTLKKKDEEEIGDPSTGLSNLFLQHINYFLLVHPLNFLCA